MGEPILTIIRGLPGSGKSTVAAALALATGAKHLETDMYFNTEDGYRFDGTKIRDAHAWCQRETKKRLDSGFGVIVSNTFTCLWEMQPYLNMGYPVNVIECMGQFECIHAVPASTIQKMRDRWEPYTSKEARNG